MLELIKKIIRLLLVAALIWGILQPHVLPLPIRPIFESIQFFIFQGEPSWVNFYRTCQLRWQFFLTWYPQAGKWTNDIPAIPEQITIDQILKSFYEVFVTQPLTKWQHLKDQLIPR